MSGQGYFLSNRERIRIDYDEEGKDSALTMLREAQAGAYWAVRSHFTAHNDPALVVMPTGSGKTGVMTLLAFGLVRKRLLIIAPSRFILEQTAEEFQTFKIARESGCLPGDLDAPKIHIVRHKLSSKDTWEELYGFDVVVSTSNCASPQYKDVYDEPPTDLFDILFFDEAHHWPAPTWDSLSQSFPDARIVGFTATPYRLDKRPIPGEIVYNYPLARAIEKGIYREVQFIPVAGYGDKQKRDRRLAEKAGAVWESEGWRAKLLVRVGRLRDTQAIQRLYVEMGLDLEIVSSQQSSSKNEAAISRAREDDQCHGLIAVGMLGEGLDLPVLQIAVLHSPYQSFPITLQFIGRICRMSGKQKNTAKLLAIPDEIQEHTQGLYELDANWVDLIPDLADAAVGIEQTRRRFAREHWDITTRARQVSVHTLRPFFAVAVYQVTGASVDITCDPRLTKGTYLLQSFLSDDKKWRVLITRTIAKPIWTSSDALLDVNYDLLIYYRVGDLLFESTTSPATASQIRKSFGEACLKLMSEKRIRQAMSQGDVLAYYNVGMRKVAYAESSVPSYKMMAGSHAEAAVRESDGHFFSVGHLFGRVRWNGDEIALGISGESAKIWAIARDHLSEFTSWCDQLASKLTNDLSIPLPYVTHLKSPELTDILPAKPYAAEFQESFYDHLQSGLRLEVEDKSGETHIIEGKVQFELLVVREDWDSTVPNRCYLKLIAQDVQVIIRYDAQTPELFRCELQPPYLSCLVKVPEKGRFRDYSLDVYLSQFPPKLFLTDGSAIVGKYLYRYQPPVYDVPERVFSVVDWDSLDCEITVEDIDLIEEGHRKRLRSKQKCSVLETTAKILPDLFSDGTFIFTDHRTGEIADFVALEPERDTLRLHFIHCKASGEKNPGARQEDAYEVLGQARKCARWMRRGDLFDTMKQRLTEERLIQGSVKDFDQLVTRCSPQTASYSVHLVQPGFKIQKIQEWHDPSIRLMFLSLYDELQSDGIDLKIIGSQDNA